MAQWGKVPVVKSDDLSSIPVTNMMMEGVKQLLQRMCHERFTYMYACAPHVCPM